MKTSPSDQARRAAALIKPHDDDTDDRHDTTVDRRRIDGADWAWGEGGGGRVVAGRV